MTRSPENKKYEMVLKEAKSITVEICGTRDFGMTSKTQMALVVRNLVIGFHQNKEEISKLKEQLASAIKDGIGKEG